MTASQTFNALFLCTGNSARSQIAEALLNHMSKGRFHAYSAGSHPAATVQPLAAQIISELGQDASRLRPKSWDEFVGPGAPKMDFIITVCDNAAGETCPVWAGRPAVAHWGVPDPAKNPAESKGFKDAWLTLRRRVELLLALPVEKLDHLAREQELRLIGKEV
ncbi:arsenate reductase ArsC [Pseudoxanthomonas winnipegensis]|uniref:arsenate reductase ArsC n=1 Tax=Pseudoxanthomonas winnipegensis TaxID=2480810 RepID=UPI002574B5C5|nr:arsenate reductase ArsC [Pseudoxanthomonas winnipegensis]WJI14027.1 arsenate reductase ArsC [Pseudoxanthomonas winnipegensis]